MKNLLLAMFAVVAISSCSKEKKLEMRLNNEEWLIDKYDFELANNGVVDPGQTVALVNVGSVKLNKDATGTITITAGGNAENYTINSWTTGENTVKLEMTDNSTKGKVTWDVVVATNEKKKQVWVREIKQGNFVFKYTYTMSKKK
jgi:hypothetical protein